MLVKILLLPAKAAMSVNTMPAMPVNIAIPQNTATPANTAMPANTAITDREMFSVRVATLLENK